MEREGVERRLAAILSTDVAAYSRLMEKDEAGTLAALKAHRVDLIEPKIAEHHGRTVKLMGDGMLAEFASVVDAVACAVEVQRAMAERNAAIPEDRRLVYRMGVHLGDVIVEGGDLYGEGVNIAARLEGLAEPGGICVSGDVCRQVKGKVEAAFDDLGEQTVKNIETPVRVYRVRLEGGGAAPGAGGAPAIEQDIRFCTADDGVRIAYATVGRGPPLVKAANWLNHLEYDWQSPVWRHLLHALARDRLLVRYDARGNGLSDWDVGEISFEAFVRDLETVADAAGLDRFDLLGVSQGCAVSIAYAVRHPERVRRLVLFGGYAAGWRAHGDPETIERQQALQTLVREGWGQDNPAFRQVFTSQLVPDASLEQMRWFNDLQRMTTSPENAVRLMNALGKIDVRPLLARLALPTLVLHCRDDARVPFEFGRDLARSIPGARFAPLDGRNHLILEHEPAWPKFVAEVASFLGTG